MEIPRAEVIKFVLALMAAGGAGFGTDFMNSGTVEDALEREKLAIAERTDMRAAHRAEKVEMVMTMRTTCLGEIDSQRVACTDERQVVREEMLAFINRCMIIAGGSDDRVVQ